MNRCRAAMMTVERPTYRKVQPLCVGTVGMHLRGGSSIRSNCSRREEEMIENPMSGQVRRPRHRAPRILRGSGCCCPHAERSAGYVRWHYEGRQSMLPWPVPKEAHHHCAPAAPHERVAHQEFDRLQPRSNGNDALLQGDCKMLWRQVLQPLQRIGGAYLALPATIETNPVFEIWGLCRSSTFNHG